MEGKHSVLCSGFNGIVSEKNVLNLLNICLQLVFIIIIMIVNFC